MGRDFELEYGVYHLESTTGSVFGAYVYGSSTGDCAYAYPAGMCFVRDEVNILSLAKKNGGVNTVIGCLKDCMLLYY